MSTMIRRRDTFRPLAPSIQPRWLIVWDMQFNVLDSTELAPFTDLEALLRETAAQWQRDGWTMESDSARGSLFCHRGAERRLLAISAADPHVATGGGPAWHGTCPTCGD
jgi:hypothetical protein